jgi:hypothetical protein
MSAQAPPRWLDECCRAYPQATFVLAATLQSADEQIQGFNTKNGSFTILSDPGARVGDRVTLLDVGGFAPTNPATYQDSRGYQIQAPGQGLVLVASYAMRVAGGSWTWTLTVDAISGTTYWAAESAELSQPGTVSLAGSSGNVALTAAQLSAGYLALTGAPSGNVVLQFTGAVQGQKWTVDTTALTFGGHTVTLQANAHNWGTVLSASGLWRVVYNGTQLYGSSLTP